MLRKFVELLAIKGNYDMNRFIFFLFCILVMQNSLILNISITESNGTFPDLSLENENTEIRHSPTPIKIINNTNGVYSIFSFSNNNEISGKIINSHATIQYTHRGIPMSFGLTSLRLTPTSVPNQLVTNIATFEFRLTNISPDIQRITIQIHDNTPGLQLPQNAIVLHIQPTNLVLAIKIYEEE